MTAGGLPDDGASTPPVTQAELRAFLSAYAKLETRMSVLEERVRQANVLALVGSNVTPLVFAVAHMIGVPPERVVGKGRGEELARARRAITWVARQVYARSSPEIGRVLKRDHTTVLDYDVEAQALRETDPAFRELSDRLAAFARSPDPIPLGDIVPASLPAEMTNPTSVACLSAGLSAPTGEPSNV